MRGLLFLAFCAVVGVAQAQNEGAEKLYRDFEKKLAEAKVFHLVYQLNPDGNFPKGKGERTLAIGNKIKESFELQEGENFIKAIAVSDGETTVIKGTNAAQPLDKRIPTPKDFTLRQSTSLARAGIYCDTAGLLPNDLKLDKLVVKNFKMLGREKVGERTAQIISFELLLGETSLLSKMWFDSETKLPVKRTFESSQDGKLTLTGTDIYLRWDFAPAVNDKTFELPK